MSKILHLSYDLRPAISTTAVRNLIRAADDQFENFSVDLLRVSNLNTEMIKETKKNYFEVNSFGLPYSLFLISSLNRAYNKLLFSFRRKKIDIKQFNAIHAHKLTYEGYIAYKLSLLTGAPLLITLRQTDFSILKYRPDLRFKYKRILKHASVVFYIVPGMKHLIRTLLGSDFYELCLRNKMTYLPNIVERDIETNIPDFYDEERFVTILRMTKKSVKRKNIKRLFEALSKIKDLNWSLDVIGSGNYSDKLLKMASDLDIDERISFLGEIPNEEIDKYYSRSLAFLMPSLSESFGMVYAEALLNGTPILYSKGVLGFDGVFNDIGIAVDPFSVNSISEGIRNLIYQNRKYREHIKNLKEDGSLKIFSAENIAKVYGKAVENVLSLSNENSILK